MNIIVLSGMPATGKSTLCKEMTREFGYPVIEKDAIKEELFDTVGFDSYHQKRALDHAANAVVIHAVEKILQSGGSAIVDNNFDVESGKKFASLIEKYDPECVCVFLYGDPDVLHARYTERDNAHARHLGHVLQEHYPPLEGDSLYYTMTREEFHEKFISRGMDAFRCPGERIEIDTTDFSRVSFKQTVEKVKEILLGEAENEPLRL